MDIVQGLKPIRESPVSVFCNIQDDFITEKSSRSFYTCLGDMPFCIYLIQQKGNELLVKVWQWLAAVM